MWMIMMREANKITTNLIFLWHFYLFCVTITTSFTYNSMFAFFQENFQALLFPLIVIVVLLILGFIGGIRRLVARYPEQSKRILAWLHKNIQRILFLAGAAWALGIIIYYHATISFSFVSQIFIMRAFAFTALALLLTVYIPTLLLTYAPGFPLNGVALRARRALGILTMGFACTHGSMEFFVTFHGSFAEVFALPTYYQLSLLFSTLAGTILVIIGMTSFDFIQQKMGKWWKRLHRLVYVVSILVLFHAFLIGSNFIGNDPMLPTVVVVIALALLFLKVGEGFKKTKKKPWKPATKAAAYAGLGLLVLTGLYLTIIALGQTNARLH